MTRVRNLPKNGDINTVFGWYCSLCCDRELIVREGGTFPDCPRHKNLSTVWKLVEAEIVKEIKRNDSLRS
jgi:hypothetical protein